MHHEHQRALEEYLDGVSSMHPFASCHDQTEPARVEQKQGLQHSEPGVESLPSKSSFTSSTVHLLVCSALGYAAVFCDLFTQGLADLSPLPESDQFDSVFSAVCTDVTLNGTTDLVLGTHAQKVTKIFSYPFFSDLFCPFFFPKPVLG